MQLSNSMKTGRNVLLASIDDGLKSGSSFYEIATLIGAQRLAVIVCRSAS